LAHDCADTDAVADLNNHCRAFVPAFERQREAERQGRAFARVASEVWELALPDLQFPIALGFAARQENLDIETVVTLYLQGFLANLVAAAQRLMPLGQTDAQGILADLNSVCLRIAAETEGKTLSHISSTAFLSDIAAMRHETLQPRIFQS
jgi:urease accessory protein